MEILMWTALVVGLAVVVRRLVPEMLAGLIDRIAQVRETRVGRDRATPVPAHTVRRLSRQRRHRRHGTAY